MTKKLKNLTALVASGILLAASCTSLCAAAKFDVVVSIDQVSVSLTQLQKTNYEVPVFVRLSQNVNLNAAEFGIEVDTRCRFDVVTRGEYAELYGERIYMDMSCATIPSVDGYAWLTWAQQSVYYHEDSAIVLLLVKLPETAQEDDLFPVHYLTQSPVSESKSHVWYNFGTNTNYAQTGAILWNDGWIQVTAPEPEEYTLGDVNEDGLINILDAIMINRAVLGREELTDTQNKAADLDGDGIPTSSDSLMLLKVIVGLEQI